MTLIGVCFVCGGYFGGGVVVVPDPDVEPSVFGRFYCYAHAPELPAVYVPAEQKAGEQ